MVFTSRKKKTRGWATARPPPAAGRSRGRRASLQIGAPPQPGRNRVQPAFLQIGAPSHPGGARLRSSSDVNLRRWLDGEGTAFPIRVPCRDMNLETSPTVFAGPYLTGEARRRFERDYNLFNVGLMALPGDLPGFAFRRARQGVARLVRTLGECARQSKARMRAGAEPECLVDFWMQDTLREIDEAAVAGRPPPAHTDDEEIGGFMFDFFVAQDASTSFLCWAVSALDVHPDVLARVRAEVGAAWYKRNFLAFGAGPHQCVGQRYALNHLVLF